MAAEGGAFIKSCWDWQSPARSVISYIVRLLPVPSPSQLEEGKAVQAFVMLVWTFQLYYAPLGLLLLFLKGALFKAVAGTFQKTQEADVPIPTLAQRHGAFEPRGGPLQEYFESEEETEVVDEQVGISLVFVQNALCQLEMRSK